MTAEPWLATAVRTWTGGDATPAAPAGPVMLFGASGEVGKRVLSELLSDERWAACTFHLLSRRPLPDHDALARCTVHVVDMSTAEALGAATATVLKSHGPCAVAFSCVAFSRPSTKNSAGVPRGGTFHMIRFLENELPNAFAKACLDHGVRHMSMFSGQGADPRKAVYCTLPYGPGILRGMGQRELDFAAFGFESVGIVRPAGILGNNNFDADGLNLKLERTDTLGRYRACDGTHGSPRPRGARAQGAAARRRAALRRVRAGAALCRPRRRVSARRQSRGVTCACVCRVVM